MASGSFKSNTGSNLEIVGEWTAAADYEGNFSTVTVKVYLTHYSLYCGALGGSYVKIGDEVFSFSKGVTQSMDSYVKTHIATYETKVYHEADGTKTVKLSVGWNFSGTYNGVSIGMLEASAEVTLDQIPRASALTSSGRAEIGGTLNVGISSYLSTHKHKVRLTLGAKNYTTDYLTGASPKITVPESFAEEITGGREGSGKITLYTYNSTGGYLGESTKSITFAVPEKAAFRPDFSLTVAPVSDSALVTAQRIFVQGITKARVQASERTYKYGAEYKECTVTVGGARYGGTSAVSKELPAGEVEITVRLTDSRGLSVTKRTMIKVLPYHLPFASRLSVFRCGETGEPSDTGAYFSVYAEAVCSSLEGRNSAELTCRYKRHAVEEGYFEVPVLSGKQTVVPASLLAEASYDVTVTCSDAAGNSTEHLTLIPTALVDMHMKNGSVRFGGYCEKEGFECSWGANFEKGLSIGEVPLTDFVTESGESGIWRWRKWASGISECFGNTGERVYDVSVPWGALCYNTANSCSAPYPEGLFTEVPVVQATLRRSDAAALISPRSVGSKDASPDYYVIYPESKTLTASVDLYCVGRWK